MNKETTGLVVYDSSPFAELVRRVRSIPNILYNIFCPQAPKPIAGTKGTIFCTIDENGNRTCSDPSVEKTLFDDIVVFLTKAYEEMNRYYRAKSSRIC